jgi:excinuclease ABC subunit A
LGRYKPKRREHHDIDEPTTGLHFEDVRKLLDVLQRSVDQGNSVVIEDHLDVIKTADWVPELGPEGSVRGGEIVARGMPEQVAAEPRSYIGGYLKPKLAKAGTTPAKREAVAAE